MKDKYGDVDATAIDGSGDESSDEEEDDDAKELTDKIEKNFFKTLSLIKSKSKDIYDKSRTDFFESSSSNSDGEEENSTSSKKERNGGIESNQNGNKKTNKKTSMKDLEREMILKKYDDEDFILI